MHVKKGDTVIVIAGKDKGRKGKILRADPKANRVVVEGVNKVKKHTKPNRSNPQGGILSIEAPLHVSNVMYYDQKANRPTRIGYRILKTGEKVRYSKVTNDSLD
jgi:large subunit ribosomal protein L24